MKKTKYLYFTTCLYRNSRGDILSNITTCHYKKIKSLKDIDEYKDSIISDLGADNVIILNIMFLGKERR